MDVKKQRLELGIDFFEAIEKTVSVGTSHSPRIFVPKKWEGKKVIVLRLEG